MKKFESFITFCTISIMVLIFIITLIVNNSTNNQHQETLQQIDSISIKLDKLEERL